MARSVSISNAYGFSAAFGCVFRASADFSCKLLDKLGLSALCLTSQPTAAHGGRGGGGGTTYYSERDLKAVD